MARRVLGGLLVVAGLVVGLGPLASLWRTGGELVDQFAEIEGYEVVESDLHTTSMLWNDGVDVATVVLRPTEATVDPQKSFRRAMTGEGFSPAATLSTGPDTNFHYRQRDDAFEADLYRFVGENRAEGTFAIGLSVFDTDALTVAPMTLLFGSFLLAPGCVLLTRRRTKEEDPATSRIEA